MRCIPEPGCDLSYLVERYACFERTAIRSYEVVAGCRGRVVAAGAMPVPSGGRYHLTPSVRPGTPLGRRGRQDAFWYTGPEWYDGDLNGKIDGSAYRDGTIDNPAPEDPTFDEKTR